MAKTPADPETSDCFPAVYPQLDPIVFTLAPTDPGEVQNVATFKVQELRTGADAVGMLAVGVSSIGGTEAEAKMDFRKSAISAVFKLILRRFPGADIWYRMAGQGSFKDDRVEEDPITSEAEAERWVSRTGQSMVFALFRSETGVRVDDLVQSAEVELGARVSAERAGPHSFSAWIGRLFDRFGIVQTVLLSFNSDKSEKELSDARWRAVVEEIRTIGSWTDDWSCAVSAPKGARVLLVRKGAGEQGVVAGGELLGDTPTQAGLRKASVRFDWAVERPPPFLQLSLLRERVPRKDDWRVQQSGILLQPHQADAIERVIRRLRNPERAEATTNTAPSSQTRTELPPDLRPRPEVHLNLLLEGVPGAGKTWWVNSLKKRLTDAGRLLRPERMITLHPASGYEEFVEGLRPPRRDHAVRDWDRRPHYQTPRVKDDVGGSWFWDAFVAGAEDRFVVQDGFFVSACAEAARFPYHDFIVVLDEINRANIPKVLGDLLTTLESSKRARWDRDAKAWNISNCAIVTLPYSGRQFFVPDNIIVIATMNSSDRSVVSLDAALRRRFATERVWPVGFADDARRREIMALKQLEPESWWTVESLRLACEDVARLLSLQWPPPEPAGPMQPLHASVVAWVLLNAGLLSALGPDAMVGHSYLFDMRDAMASGEPSDQRWWRASEPARTAAEVWRRFILPQLTDAIEAAHATDSLAEGVGAGSRPLKSAMMAAAASLQPIGRLTWSVDGASPLLHRTRISLEPTAGS